MRSDAAPSLQPPLTLPILLAPAQPLNPTSPIPCRPEYIAAWTSVKDSIITQHVALASKSSIYIHSSPLDPLPSPNQIPPPPAQPLPTIKTPDARAFSPKRPSVGRTHSAPRSRADSITSSVITTSSWRRVSAFSPPTTAANPQAVLSSAQATTSPHKHSWSTDIDKAELRDHLREQRDRDGKETIGLGIGLGRRSIHVHSKDDVDASGSTSPTGVSKARSAASFESGRTASGIRGWLRGDDGEKEREKEMREKVAEIEVQREIEREVEDGQKEAREMEVVERAGAGSSTPRQVHHHLDDEASGSSAKVKRIVLKGRKGRIVRMKAFESAGVLAVLRQQGTLDLISLDSLSVISSISLEQPEPKLGEAGSSKAALRIAPFWSWRDLHFAQSGDQCMILAEGLPWPCAMPSPNGEVTRVVMLERQHEQWRIAAGLELPGTGHTGVCTHENKSFILHFLPHSLTSYRIVFSSQTTSNSTSSPSSRAVSSAHPSPNLRPGTPLAEKEIRRSRSLVSLNEEHKEKEKEGGFAKFLAVRRPQNPPKEVVEDVKAGIGEGKEVERDGYGDWTAVRIEREEGVAIGEGIVDLFRCDGSRLKVLGSISVGGAVQDALSDGQDTIAVRTDRALLAYDRSNRAESIIKYTLRATHDLASCVTVDSRHHLYAASETQVNRFDPGLNGDPERMLRLAKVTSVSNIPAVVPYGLAEVFVADVPGNVSRQTLSSVLGLDSPVTVLKVISRSQGDLVVAGDEDGVVRIWLAEPFQLLGSFTAFADPVQSIVLLDSDRAPEWQDCLLCASQDGTVGIISLTELELLYLIPASRAPLRRTFFDAKDVLLAYANGKARVWNYQTGEFRRSTGLEAGEDMLASGDWTEVALEVSGGSTLPLGPASSGIDCDSDMGRAIALNLRAVGKWVQANKLTISPLPALRGVLSTLLPFGINEEIDQVCQRDLGISAPEMPVLSASNNDLASEYPSVSGADVWTVSPEATGLRQLAIVTLLRPFLDAKETELAAAKVVSFYSGCMSAVEPSLDFFADYYLDPASDVQQAAKTLFKARLERMTEEEVEVTIAAVKPALPENDRVSGAGGAGAVRALTIVGGIALHRYQSVNPSVLKTTAEVILAALNDPRSPILALAIELVHSGFQTWQTYLDPMSLLRRLFHLATHNPPPPAISASARLAVLHIANLSPGLFMSTLSMDILNAETVEGRTSIMKLCVFMARKKPGVIAHGLPRICEAVVKSLDPNVGKMRDDVWEAATVILNELVLAFTTIDFHSGTQKLAVGTHEGAVIMYDLKTASRLYVLEPHHVPVSSVNFAPDGRRLVTVSIEGGDVTVWKIGSSLSGFFTVGGPPRQGGAKGEPFKRMEFIRADNGPLEETGALSDVKVEWLGERQVRVMIQETALTFEA